MNPLVGAQDGKAQLPRRSDARAHTLPSCGGDVDGVGIGQRNAPASNPHEEAVVHSVCYGARMDAKRAQLARASHAAQESHERGDLHAPTLARERAHGRTSTGRSVDSAWIKVTVHDVGEEFQVSVGSVGRSLWTSGRPRWLRRRQAVEPRNDEAARHSAPLVHPGLSRRRQPTGRTDRPLRVLRAHSAHR